MATIENIESVEELVSRRIEELIKQRLEPLEQQNAALAGLLAAIGPQSALITSLATERLDQLKGHQKQQEEWWGTARCALECDCDWRTVKAHAVANGIEIIGERKKQKIRASDVRRLMRCMGRAAAIN